MSAVEALNPIALHVRSMSEQVRLNWNRFTQMSTACKEFKEKSCIYAIADSSGKPLYLERPEGEMASTDGIAVVRRMPWTPSSTVPAA